MRIVVLALLGGCSFSAAQVAADSDGGVTVGDVASDQAADAPEAHPFELTGAHWLMPCTTGDLGLHNCGVGSPYTATVALPSGGIRWSVTVRIRGVMEAIGYSGGTAGTGGWYAGGNPNDLANNVYRFDVSSPAKRYWINHGTPMFGRASAFDYTATFVVDDGATLTFYSSGQDLLQWANWDGGAVIAIPGVTDPAQPYDGQFARMDVISATPI